jgi:hypothetical protein
MHIDPVALALEAQPKLSSTGCDQGQQAQDKRRLRNGGDGYGPKSW